MDRLPRVRGVPRPWAVPSCPFRAKILQPRRLAYAEGVRLVQSDNKSLSLCPKTSSHFRRAGLEPLVLASGSQTARNEHGDRPTEKKHHRHQDDDRDHHYKRWRYNENGQGDHYYPLPQGERRERAIVFRQSRWLNRRFFAGIK